MAHSALKPKVMFRPEAIEKAKERMRERASKAESHYASVGIHEAEGEQPKIDYYGKPGNASLAQVAAAHEFGAGVPERSWLRTWVDQNRARLMKEVIEAGRAQYQGDKSAIANQGERWAVELREWIELQDGGLRALSAVTVAAKDKAGLENPTTPLVATHQLVSAIRAMLDGEYL